jgi:HTH-type transcriptional regulator/antitoxin HigA
MAVALSAAFPDTTAFDWMKWESAHRLANIEQPPMSAEKMARTALLYSLAPIQEMQKRGWLDDDDGRRDLENQLKTFFAVDTLDGDFPISVALRRAKPLANLNPVERAWCFRARQLGRALKVGGAFSTNRLDMLEQKLRRLAAYPKEAAHVAEVLDEYGIKFVVIEPLQSAKIDGAALWLDENSPIIAVSVRYDRIDAFWFTLMHEFSHVRNGDASVDTDLVGDGTRGAAMTLIEDEQERRANEEAASALIPADELDSFIRRVGPLYSKVRIAQFAHRMKVHPGIIVGQLQHRGEISFRTNREMLAKIRGSVLATALTDGWGRTIHANLL